MAKQDRCEICDYMETEGSSVGNTAPGSNGKVRRHGKGVLCDLCISEIAENLGEISKEEDDS